MAKRREKQGRPMAPRDGYNVILSDIVDLLDAARRTAARSVNAVMTATYWEIGRRIVEHEQSGSTRALYGEALLDRLAADLTGRYGRGFSRPNRIRCRQFYIAFPPARIRSTLSNESDPKRALSLSELARAFPLPWSHYVLLVTHSRSHEALDFYHSEALRGGWTVRQLVRQIDSQFYERTALSRSKAAMLKKGQIARAEDAVSPDEEVKDPLVLEYFGDEDYPVLRGTGPAQATVHPARMM
jgi:hypothetical protein